MKADPDLIKIVKDDIIYLENEWDHEISDNSLRISSSILRRLLIEGALNKVAHMMKIKIRILCPLMYKEIDFDELDDASFWQAGGGRSKGLRAAEITLYDRALSESEIKNMYEGGRKRRGKTYPEKLSKYLHQPSFVVNGVKINREEVIKYVNNKIGGTHYDPNRKDNKLEEKYKLLDKVNESMEVASRNAVYYELVSVGQSIIKSKDVIKLRKRADQFLEK